jgi:hypothetical protein
MVGGGWALPHWLRSIRIFAKILQGGLLDFSIIINLLLLAALFAAFVH